MYVDLKWVLVLTSTAAAFSALSPLITARRLNFFSSTLPHASLLAVAVGYLLSFFMPGTPALWAVLVSVPISFLQIYLIQRGVKEDTATSVFVAFTTSASVAAMYYILTAFPASVNLWSYILGDPLLTTWEDTYVTVAISAVVFALCYLFYEREVLIGVDRDYARLIGINVKVHDYFVVTLLTVSSVSLLKSIGFVIEHVAMLLPSAIAAQLARNSKHVFLISVSLSTLMGFLSLFISLALNAAPSAVFGLLLVAAYLAALAMGERK